MRLVTVAVLKDFTTDSSRSNNLHSAMRGKPLKMIERPAGAIPAGFFIGLFCISLHPQKGRPFGAMGSGKAGLSNTF